MKENKPRKQKRNTPEVMKKDTNITCSIVTLKRTENAPLILITSESNYAMSRGPNEFQKCKENIDQHGDNSKEYLRVPHKTVDIEARPPIRRWSNVGNNSQEKNAVNTGKRNVDILAPISSLNSSISVASHQYERGNVPNGVATNPDLDILILRQRKNSRSNSSSSLADNLNILTILAQQRNDVIKKLSITHGDQSKAISRNANDEHGDAKSGTQTNTNDIVGINSDRFSTENIISTSLAIAKRNNAGINLPPVNQNNAVIFRQRGIPYRCQERVDYRRASNAFLRHLRFLRTQYSTATILQIEEIQKNFNKDEPDK